ncbi:hypothetical protein X798_04096 [Onchocerca flexuosa]|uniref:Uncharacterized protein n=1 Tax=Onchocerca flexuosa TaxID=387005 RepID=A0A238BV51_9BILA|nr:hypothetical protein X798_04096 [Onchocerca flexuosa]
MNENISSLLVEQTIMSCACLLAFLHAADSPHTFSPDEALFLRAFYNVAVVIRHQALHVTLTLCFHFFHLVWLESA